MEVNDKLHRSIMIHSYRRRSAALSGWNKEVRGSEGLSLCIVFVEAPSLSYVTCEIRSKTTKSRNQLTQVRKIALYDHLHSILNHHSRDRRQWIVLLHASLTSKFAQSCYC